ncbi:hypothetical protein BO71DRAFT_393709 [Aspergillus ellipticus CBS 707.79]|uniref:DUF1365-domain-containing protein n=1 Tax=Aspergillus ellipticus CBS 707.79 TaxID=1448320 RepID=A0A319EH07_9EURO|nr:hypothetical protein BO71DRAFT_393709 [Aspergillus ellipticus CBS 707.79]
MGAGVCLALLTPILIFLIFLVQALFSTRQLVSLSDKDQTVIGKPLFFPVTFNHMRFIPKKDRFSNRFLLMGVPVGLRCRIGNAVAIDDKSLDLHRPPGEKLTRNRIFSHLSCWFSFDSIRYLHRGSHDLDLREKLDQFLISENQDPSKWPYAYLLAVPQFLGWSRAVVTWWYLYSEARELDAMILEINNSYDEKRNVFLKVNRVSEPQSPQSTELPATSTYLDSRCKVQSLLSNPQSTFYKGIWTKRIFASPFEKVNGQVTNRFMDPLQPESWKFNAPFSNMTTLGESGEVKMATRMTCAETPLDPTQMTTLQLVKFLLRWTLPGTLTTIFIIATAIRIRFTGLMKMMRKPPVRSGSVGRHPTKTELDLEPFFRSYLTHCVETHPDPVEITYLPCRSFSTETIHLRSPSCSDKESSAVGIKHLTIEPAEPEFYTRITTYADMHTALEKETQSTDHEADQSAQRLIVSDSALLGSILESNPSPKTEKQSSGAKSTKVQFLLFLCRAGLRLSFMDDFVLGSLDLDAGERYVSAVIRYSIMERVAFGSEDLLWLYGVVGGLVMRWFMLEGILFVAQL